MGDINHRIADITRGRLVLLALIARAASFLIHRSIAFPTATAPAPTAAVVTARRRGRRRWLVVAARRRWNLGATAVPTVATTVSVTAPAVTAGPRAATSTDDRRTNKRRSKEEAKCFGFCGNGGGSKWESCCKHDGYAAQFQLHDASLC
jgi:hypothetical protein